MFTTTQLSLDEGGSATYQVRATTSRVGGTIVNIEMAHSGITVNSNSLTSNSINWQDYQTVTASADAADNNEQATIRHSIPASADFVANNYAGIVSVSISHTVVEETSEPESQTNLQIAQQVQLPPADYDKDDDSLIDIGNLVQLNVIRFDLNGDGRSDKKGFAYTYAPANMGISAEVQAQGYELTGDLDFDSNKNEQADEEDVFGNGVASWGYIGTCFAVDKWRASPASAA